VTQYLITHAKEPFIPYERALYSIEKSPGFYPNKPTQMRYELAGNATFNHTCKRALHSMKRALYFKEKSPVFHRKEP